MTLDTLLTGHDRFKENFANHRPYWARLVEEGQHPPVLWIGCSDSRVIPEQIVNAPPGGLFVMRNVANVVPPYGTTGDATAAALEFAVLDLGVEHIIVCGHTYCGGVEAVLNPGGLSATSHLARWVSWIRPALSQVEASGVPEEARYLETIKANVLLQRANLAGYPEVSQALKAGRLSLHGWLFDLETGDLQAYDDAARQWRVLGAPSNEQALKAE